MAQHYLLSGNSKTLTLKEIFRLTEEQALQLLKANRWGNPDNIRDVCCPHCGIRHHAYFLPSRKRWCCKHCKRHFYITILLLLFINCHLLIFWQQFCSLLTKSKAFRQLP